MAHMRAKDYSLIAEAFTAARECNARMESAQAFTDMQVGYERLVKRLADRFAINPTFNRDKFLTECGVDNDLQTTRISEHVYRV